MFFIGGKGWIIFYLIRGRRRGRRIEGVRKHSGGTSTIDSGGAMGVVSVGEGE